MDETIGDRLRKIRGDRSQADFADLLGVARKTLIRYESDERKPDIDLILRLNLLFGIQPMWLMAGLAEDTKGQKLSPEEHRLVTTFRALDEAGRKMVIGMIERMRP